VLPLLADLLSSPSESLRSNASKGEHSCAASGSGPWERDACSRDACKWCGPGNLAGRGALAGRGCCSAAEVAGAVVCSLEGMASSCVQQSSDKWLYDQALQLLLSMYREPSKVSAGRH